jgi:arylsulfatase A-like enzyme
MIACGPGFEGGKVIDELVSLIDVAPTILSAAGIEKSKSMRGRPLQKLVSGKAADWPKQVFAQISESQVGRAVRTKRWKYSVSAPDVPGGSQPSSDVYVEEYLYDLEADPHERKNLVSDPSCAGIREKLAALLKRCMEDAGEQAPEILPAK